jgi:Baseplate J-like protein
MKQQQNRRTRGMYHYQPSRPHRKGDRPILFRAPTTQAEREHDQPAPHIPTGEQAGSVSPGETASDAGKDTETQPGAVDLQLLCLLVWWMQQQAEAEATAQAAAETIIVESTPVVDPAGSLPRRGTRALPWLVLVGCSLCLVVLLSVVVSTWLFATTTVTLMPTETTLSTTTTVTLATGHAHPTGPSVPGRLLSTLTLSQARTVPTTGIGHQPAQAAHGRVTFYNAALTSQTIPAGTLLVGADGVQVVTNQDAVVPAAHLPTDGQATVSAHAVQMGPAGNIGAGDLHGACCRENVFVENSAAFTGGQHAYSYPMVTAHDLDGAVATLTTSLEQSIQAAYTAQLTPTEALVTPVTCKPSVTSPFHVGDEAQSITLTLTDTCTGVAYDQQALQAALLSRLSGQAQAQLGGDSTLLGALQVSTRQVKREGSTFTLSVQGTGVWAHQFSQTDLQRFAVMIAGKNQQQATTLLLHEPGVSEVAMSTSTLPTNPQQIRLLVLYRPA